MQISILAIEKRVILLYWPLGTDPYFFEEELRQLLKQNSCTAKTVACVAGAGGKGWGNRVKRKGESPPSLSFSSISSIPLCVCYVGYKNCGNKIKQVLSTVQVGILMLTNSCTSLCPLTKLHAQPKGKKQISYPRKLSTFPDPAPLKNQWPVPYYKSD